MLLALCLLCRWCAAEVMSADAFGAFEEVSAAYSQGNTTAATPAAE